MTYVSLDKYMTSIEAKCLVVITTTNHFLPTTVEQDSLEIVRFQLIIFGGKLLRVQTEPCMNLSHQQAAHNIRQSHYRSNVSSA